MSDEQPGPPRPGDHGTLAALLEDRLEGAVAQVSGQARNAAALVAAAETTAKETRTMVRAASGALEEIRELLAAATSSPGPAATADPAAVSSVDGEPTAAGEGAGRREGEEAPATGGGYAVSQDDAPDPDGGAGDVEDNSQNAGEAEETGETEDRPAAEASAAGEDGGATDDAGRGAGGDRVPGARTEAAGTEPDPDPQAAHDDTRNDVVVDRSAPPSRSDKEIVRLLEQIGEKLDGEPPSRAAQKEILETLGTIRAAQDAQEQVIAAAIALTPTAATEEPGMPPAWQAFQEVMARLDGIARIIRPVPVEPKEQPPPTIEAQAISEAQAPALPPPEPAVDPDELREAVDTLIDAAARPRRAFARFAGVAILLVFLAAGALGVLLQQQYTVLELPDATNGWKDRVWELTGEDIARCIAASSARGGTCAVTVEPAAAP